MMIQLNNLSAKGDMSAPVEKKAPSEIVLFALKALAFVAACFVVGAVVYHLYYVALVAGLISITTLALRHCMIEESNTVKRSKKAAPEYDLENPQEKNSKTSSAEPSPRQHYKKSSHHPVVEIQVLTQQELDDQENTQDRIRERVAKLPRYMDNSYLDIPREARHNHKHPYWDKYKINHPKWELRKKGPDFKTVT